MDSEKKILTTAADEDITVRKLLQWLNTYEALPEGIVIADNYLEDDAPAMCLASETDNIIRRYITGGYQAQFSFRILYRVQPDGNNERLKADEVLNKMADWVVNNWKNAELSAARSVRSINVTGRSALLARYDNGDEDHSVQLLMTYEVI